MSDEKQGGAVTGGQQGESELPQEGEGSKGNQNEMVADVVVMHGDRYSFIQLKGYSDEQGHVSPESVGEEAVLSLADLLPTIMSGQFKDVGQVVEWLGVLERFRGARDTMKNMELVGEVVKRIERRTQLWRQDLMPEAGGTSSGAMTDAVLEGHTVEDLYEIGVALLLGYARLEQKYDRLLVALAGAKLPVPTGASSLNEDVPSESGSIERGESDSLQESTVVRIEVDESPLTVEQMGVLFNALTNLTTKYWLISQGRFADLIEFSKSHDARFVREARVAITRLSYNSPLNFDIKLSATDVAQGLTTTIDGIIQSSQRLKQMGLATQTKALELQQMEQRFAEEIRKAQQQEAFDQEKRQLDLARQQIEVERLRLEVEQQRLGLLELRMETQRKSMEHAFDIAHKVISQLHPQADDATKQMLVQTYVADILQLSGISFKSVTVIEADQTTAEEK